MKVARYVGRKEKNLMKRLLVWKIRRSYEISFSVSPRDLLSVDLRCPRPLWLLDVGVQAALQSDHRFQYLLPKSRTGDKNMSYPIGMSLCHNSFLAPSHADRNRRHGRFLVQQPSWSSSPVLPPLSYIPCPGRTPFIYTTVSPAKNVDPNIPAVFPPSTAN